ncbi:Sapep family Mn(2+)-dependent dipeptidase [Bifidobacterium avesanii]|uniref:Sapep family Mn(2+)-dependent dipeptidase n=1 Tax=Bifidobacterium avesanii TaxID=1798157 RepID=A0A7K3TEI6_9BIFI|nr:Sapep family Mn(2+)-dependent dipeptidase [Bifidobacterium avesanii]KAB8295502.1 peptidase M20 [Bifidobacterium avesanii]NEG77507.1 Sapep family Mn(2+)-dependent dipeptidase [Bifidobacterium avesanii]
MTTLAQQAVRWFNDHRDEYISDLLQWVEFPSVSKVWEGKPGAPYGKGVADMFNHVRAEAARCGFESHDYEGYAIGVEYGKGLAKDDPKRKDIALVSHLDVVPAGEGWDSEPFQPYERDGYIVGRGADDNKRAALADFYLLKFYREQGIEFAHDLRILYGGAEETGLDDMRQFVASHGVPFQAVITDGPFPVNNAQKGSLGVTVSITVPEAFVGFKVGTTSNSIPGEASITLRGVDPATAGETLRRHVPGFGGKLEVEPTPDGVTVNAIGSAGHAAFPENAINAIAVLADALFESGLLSGDANVFAGELRRWASSAQGLGVAYEDEASGATTASIGTIVPADDRLELGIDIRYAVTQRSEDIRKALIATFAGRNGEITGFHDFPPYFVPADDPRVQVLLDNYNTVLGVRGTTICMGGGTHARVIPGALNYGPGFGQNRDELRAKGLIANPPTFIPEGKGGCHSPDEWMSVDEVSTVFGIYAQGIVALDRLLAEHPEYALSQFEGKERS